MYAVVLSCLFVLEGVTGNYLFPAWRPSPQNVSLSQPGNNETATSAYYFETFNLRKLNPVYWFYDSSEVDKLDKLYELVKCIIEEETSACREQLQLNRKLFEKNLKSKQTDVQKNDTKINANINYTSTETSKPTHIYDLQHRDKPEAAVIVEVHNSSTQEFIVTESGENATISSETNVTLASS